MAISKPRGANGARAVFAYDPAVGRKIYVGTCEAFKLAHEKAIEIIVKREARYA